MAIGINRESAKKLYERRPNIIWELSKALENNAIKPEYVPKVKALLACYSHMGFNVNG